MGLIETENTITIMPSQQKRLWLIFPLAALLGIVAMTTTFMSVPFLVYTAVLLWALVNLIISVFKTEPVLILSPQGLLSNMTINGRNAGLVKWPAITEIRDVKTFGFIKSIEVYTKDSGAKFFLNLASDEAAITHSKLLALLKRYWQTYGS